MQASNVKVIKILNISGKNTPTVASGGGNCGGLSTLSHEYDSVYINNDNNNNRSLLSQSSEITVWCIS